MINILPKIQCLLENQRFTPSFLGIAIQPLYLIRRPLFLGIRKYAKKLNGRLLDFGCGEKPYEGFFSVNKYIGLDLKESGHSHHNSKIDIYYDGVNIPFQDEYFDSVFSSEVLEHVFNVNEILKELNRVLKKDGLILITVPFVWEEHETPFDFGRYSSFGIESILKNNGFEVFQHEKTGNSVSVIHQLLITYMTSILFTKNKWINSIINFIFIMPVTLGGLFFSKILPQSKKLFFNNIVLARKMK